VFGVVVNIVTAIFRITSSLLLSEVRVRLCVFWRREEGIGNITEIRTTWSMQR